MNELLSNLHLASPALTYLFIMTLTVISLSATMYLLITKCPKVMRWIDNKLGLNFKGVEDESK